MDVDGRVVMIVHNMFDNEPVNVLQDGSFPSSFYL